MQYVTPEYKESMQSLMRDRGYMKVNLVMKDEEMNENACLHASDAAYYSTDRVFDAVYQNASYITFEDHFVTVDGTMKVLPPQQRNAAGLHLYKFIDTGFISEKPISGKYMITIDFGGSVFDIQGMRINFGDNYPTYFKISNDKGTVRDYRNNNSIFEMRDELKNTKKIFLTIYPLRYLNRVRIYSISFTHSLELSNEDIETASLRYHISPISETLPQVNLSVKLIDYDNRFDSYHAYFDRDSEIEVSYGYDISQKDKTEWIKGALVYGENYEIDENAVTIYGRDVLQNQEDNIYYQTRQDKTNVHDLIADVCNAANLKNYIIDSKLNDIIISNPVPPVSCKEALQIIANACHCQFDISREGWLRFSLGVRITVSSDFRTYYSDLDGMGKGNHTGEYIDFTPGHVPVDGTIQALPPERSGYPMIHSGFISKNISNDEGYFEMDPVLNIWFEENQNYNRILFNFGESIPASFVIRAYRADAFIKQITCENVMQNYKATTEFNDISRLQIEFIQTQKAHNRIILKDISFQEIGDVVIDKMNMLDIPVKTTNLIKDIAVVYYEYTRSAEKENLYSGDIEVKTVGEEHDLYFTDPIVEYELLSDNWEIVNEGAYFLRVRALQSGNIPLSVEGYKYNVLQKTFVETLNKKGETITWENPLISSEEETRDLALWLKDFYTVNDSYKFANRGNPEIDVNDILYQTNEADRKITVRVTDTTLDFNGAFAGELETRGL